MCIALLNNKKVARLSRYTDYFRKERLPIQRVFCGVVPELVYIAWKNM